MSHAPLVAGRPLVEQIIETHEVDGAAVRAGSVATVEPDRVYVQDGNAPTISELYRKHGFTDVFDPARVSFVFDHSVLVADVDMADRMKEAENFAADLGVDVHARGQGISHVIAAELGWFEPGALVLGSDSHTCAAGGSGALGLGMGASDIAAVMVTGQTWLKVPETVIVELVGVPHPQARARDVMISLLNDHGQEPFLYRSVEFTGPWVERLSSDASASLASLGVELGAKCVFVPDRDGEVPTGHADVRRMRVDIGAVGPMVSLPHLPANAAFLADVGEVAVNYVFIGSCTNSRIEDLREIADILRDRQVRVGVQMVVTPGSLGVFLQASAEGVIEVLVRAGAVVTPPGCGACVGTQGPLPARGDVVLSTMNRNFQGRMGNPDAEIYLASPLVAATAAITGFIPPEVSAT